MVPEHSGSYELFKQKNKIIPSLTKPRSEEMLLRVEYKLEKTVVKEQYQGRGIELADLQERRLF